MSTDHPEQSNDSDETKPQQSKAVQPLEGRVAQVLNERELVINLGSRDGVLKGMHFTVLAEEALEIPDPETNEILGVIDREKVRVNAIEVHDRLTVCRTYNYRTVGGGWSGLTFTSTMKEMLGPEKRIYETLDATKEAYPAPLSQEESYVHRGDRVRRIYDLEE